MVAGADGAELVGAASPGPVRHGADRGALEPATRLGELHVLVRPDAAHLDQRARPLDEHALELAFAQGERAAAAAARRRSARDLVDERLLAPAELVHGDRQGEEPDAAVDVVTHAARRDDSVRGLRRRDPSDREPVSLVHVRHRERGVDDPGQRGHVLELLERLVVADRVEQLLVGEHPRRDAHVRTRLARNLPERLVQPAELNHRCITLPRGRLDAALVAALP